MANAKQWTVKFTEKQLETIALGLQQAAEANKGKERENLWLVFDKLEDQIMEIRKERIFGSK